MLIKTNSRLKKEFVQYLQNKLQEKGWSVDLGIGQGDSCVDLAIKDDLHAATARDCDQLRPTVLNGLGWKVLSVWTVDWWLDPEHNLTKLVKALEEI